MKAMSRLPGNLQPVGGLQTAQWYAYQGCSGRKRRQVDRVEEEPDLCHTTKRFLSEETMATCFQLQQLDLATHTAHSRPGHLSIQMVPSCQGDPRENQDHERGDVYVTNGACYCSGPTSSEILAEANVRQVQPLPPVEEDDNLQSCGSMVDCSSLSSNDEYSWHHGDYNDLWQSYHRHNIFSCLSHPRQTVRLPSTSPPAPPWPTPLDQGNEHKSRRTSLLSRYPGVNITVTPSTPTNSDCPTLALSEREDHSRAVPDPTHPNKMRRKQWEVVLEDVSSDSSDGLESPERPLSLWLAPEIRHGLKTAHKDVLLPPAIMEGMTRRPNMELVPWVGPERHILKTLKESRTDESKNLASENEQPDNEEEDMAMEVT